MKCQLFAYKNNVFLKVSREFRLIWFSFDPIAIRMTNKQVLATQQLRQAVI